MITNYSNLNWNYFKNILTEEIFGGRGSLYGEKSGLHIVAAAWMNPQGDIYTGNYHYEALRNAAVEYNEKEAADAINSDDLETIKSSGWIDGFLTSDDKFVSREEAKRISAAAHQLKKKSKMANNLNIPMDVSQFETQPLQHV